MNPKANIINFLTNEDTQQLAAGFFISVQKGSRKKSGKNGKI